jgi:integrase
VRRWVIRPALRAAGLPEDLRTYDLRHSHASLLIDLGANPLEVAQRMGHTDPTVTLRVYGHLFDGAQEKLTEKLDALRARTPLPVAGDVVSLDERRAVTPA